MSDAADLHRRATRRNQAPRTGSGPRARFDAATRRRLAFGVVASAIVVAAPLTLVHHGAPVASRLVVASPAALSPLEAQALTLVFGGDAAGTVSIQGVGSAAPIPPAAEPVAPSTTSPLSTSPPTTAAPPVVKSSSSSSGSAYRSPTTTAAPRPAPSPTTTTTAPRPSPAPAPPPSSPPPSPPSSNSSNSQTGQASWYGAPDGTCAHPSLPFGTVVTVTNLANGATTTCTVEDRGPYSGGRIIDLSEGTFSQIADPSEGVIQVRIQW